MGKFGVTYKNSANTTTGTGNSTQKAGQKDYSKEVQEAIRQKIANHSVTSYQDLERVVKSSVSLFGTDVKTDAQKEKAYQDYAEGLLNGLYDVNGDGKVTVTEFAQVETKSTKQEQQVSILAQKETISQAKANLQSLPQMIQQARQKGDEKTAKELEGLQKELQDCIKEYEELEKTDVQRSANLFAQNLDINGNGNIDTEELAFFQKTADGMNDNYTYDGKIKDYAERTLTKSFTGETASEEFKAKYGEVIKKYQQGQPLTSKETELLKESQAILKSGMKKASGISE